MTVYFYMLENNEILLPPPYPTCLPSYDEASDLSPLQLQLYDEQVLYDNK